MIRVFGVLITAGLVVLCGSVGSVEADCHRNRAVFCPSVVPTYNAVVTPAYVAPTYATTTVVTHVEVVPLAVPVPVVNEFYYSLQPFSADVLVDAAASRAARIVRAEQQANVQGTGQGALQGAVQNNRRPAANQSKPEAVVPGKIGDGKVSLLMPGSDEPPAGLAKIVGNSCIRCHSASKASGGLDLSDLKAVPKLIRAEAFRRANNGDMPKGGTPLPDEQVELFDDWTTGFLPAVVSR